MEKMQRETAEREAKKAREIREAKRLENSLLAREETETLEKRQKEERERLERERIERDTREKEDAKHKLRKDRARKHTHNIPRHPHTHSMLREDVDSNVEVSVRHISAVYIERNLR